MIIPQTTLQTFMATVYELPDGTNNQHQVKMPDEQANEFKEKEGLEVRRFVAGPISYLRVRLDDGADALRLTYSLTVEFVKQGSLEVEEQELATMRAQAPKRDEQEVDDSTPVVPSPFKKAKK